MIHPSYVELMKVVNNDVEIGEEPVVNSRYSIVLASARRARQLIAGADTKVTNPVCNKPLSIAVEELYRQDVRILNEEEALKAIEIAKEYEKRQEEKAALQKAEAEAKAKEESKMAAFVDDFSDDTLLDTEDEEYEEELTDELDAQADDSTEFAEEVGADEIYAGEDEETDSTKSAAKADVSSDEEIAVASSTVEEEA